MATNHDIINELQKAYGMELETVENYLAASIDLDGVRAEEIKKALASEIEEELGHSRKLGKRIKVLEGRVPGSLDLERGQQFLQPPKDSTDACWFRRRPKRTFLWLFRAVGEVKHPFGIARHAAGACPSRCRWTPGNNR